MTPKFSLRFLFISIAMVAIICYVVIHCSNRNKVRKLLLERSDRPGGNIDIFWTGREVKQIDAELSDMGKLAQPFILEFAGSNNRKLKIEALRQIGKSQIVEGNELLKLNLQDKDSTTQQVSVRSIGELKSRDAVPELIGMFPDVDVRVQKSIVVAMGQIEDPRCIELLEQASQSENHSLKTLARDAHSKCKQAMERNKRSNGMKRNKVSGANSG